MLDLNSTVTDLCALQPVPLHKPVGDVYFGIRCIKDNAHVPSETTSFSLPPVVLEDLPHAICVGYRDVDATSLGKVLERFRRFAITDESIGFDVPCVLLPAHLRQLDRAVTIEGIGIPT